MPNQGWTKASSSSLVLPTVAAAALQVSMSEIYRMLDDGRLEGVRLGGRTRRVKRESLERLMKGGIEGETCPWILEITAPIEGHPPGGKPSRSCESPCCGWLSQPVRHWCTL